MSHNRVIFFTFRVIACIACKLNSLFNDLCKCFQSLVSPVRLPYWTCYLFFASIKLLTDGLKALPCLTLTYFQGEQPVTDGQLSAETILDSIIWPSAHPPCNRGYQEFLTMLLQTT